MKTFLAQNKFNSDSADAAECEAVANASPPSTATANLSDGVGAKPIPSPSEAAIDSCQEPVAADLCPRCKLRPVDPALLGNQDEGHVCGQCWIDDRNASDLISNSGAPQPRGEPAQTNATQPAGSPNISTDCIGLLFYHARRLALPRFAPDYEAIWNAMHDKNAPRMLAGDPVWADASPLFLKANG